MPLQSLVGEPVSFLAGVELPRSLTRLELAVNEDTADRLPSQVCARCSQNVWLIGTVSSPRSRVY